MHDEGSVTAEAVRRADPGDRRGRRRSAMPHLAETAHQHLALRAARLPVSPSGTACLHQGVRLRGASDDPLAPVVLALEDRHKSGPYLLRLVRLRVLIVGWTCGD